MRPTVDAHLLRRFAAAGAIFAGIRLSILAALSASGPDVTAAITPLTPVKTLGLTLALRMETLAPRTPAGAAQLGGMFLCCFAAVLMGISALRGPRLFGTVLSGAHAPSNVAAGVAWMLLNTLLSAAVQVVNKRTLARFPTVSTTAAVAAFAVLFLLRARPRRCMLRVAVCTDPQHLLRTCFAAPAAALAPAAAWRPDAWMLAACVYSGVAATGVNNVLLARANSRLGPTLANFYMPVQPLTTVIIDYFTLGDAVYLANLLCGLGVAAGMALAVLGKHRGDASRRAAAAAPCAEPPPVCPRAEERAGLLCHDGLQLGVIEE